MGNGRVLLSGVPAPSKEFGVILGMEEVRFFVVVDLFPFVFQPQMSHLMRDLRVESWGGATGQPEIW